MISKDTRVGVKGTLDDTVEQLDHYGARTGWDS